MLMTNTALGIDEIVRRPVLVAESAPDRIVVVDRHRIGDFEIRDGTPDISANLFECEFRRVHADYDQTLILVFLPPGTNVGQRPQAVDAGVGPEVDENDFALELLLRQRL